MAELSRSFERDDLGRGQFRLKQYLRAIAFLENGNFKRIASAFQDGDLNNPNIVDDAPFLARIDGQGNWRVHPTREADVWFSIGAPFVNPSNPTRVSLNPFTRDGNVLTSVNTNFDARILHGGHFLKLEFQLKNGYTPPQGRVAFPLDARGVTRVGDELRVDGKAVMQLTRPVVYDADDPNDVREITVSFQSVGGQLYCIYLLPNLSGMTAPVIDPTLSLQPDATDGIDTRIAQNQANTNFGTNANLSIGEENTGAQNYRTLIKFDLSGLPSSAVISSTSLIFRVNADNSSNARTFRAFRQKRAWVETQATWNIYSTGNNWQTAGGFGSNDCEQTEIGNCSFTNSESIGTFKTFALTPTTKADLDLGNGWLLKADTESDDGYRFDSSDAATASHRPALEIVYSTATTYYQDLSGGITPAGVLQREPRRIFGGALTANGALVRQPRRSQVGSIEPSAVLARQPQRNLAGALEPSATLVRQPQRNLAGALEPSATLVRQLQRNLAGEIEPEGELTLSTLMLKALAGTLVPSGALIQQPQRMLDGAVDLSGELVRQIELRLSGALEPEGALAFLVGKRFDGEIELQGIFTRQSQKRLAGTLALSSMILRQAERILDGELPLAGEITKAKVKLWAFDGEISSYGELSRQPQRILIGTLEPMASLVRSVARTFAGIFSLSGSLAREPRRILDGDLSPEGDLSKTKVKLRSLDGEIEPQGSLNLQVRRIVAGTLAASGTRIRSVARNASGAIATTGNLVRSIQRGLVGILNPDGTLARSKVKLKVLVGSVTPSGTVIRSATRAFTGQIVLAGTVTRRIARSLGGTLAPSGNVRRLVARILTGNLTPIGALMRLIVEGGDGRLNAWWFRTFILRRRQD